MQKILATILVSTALSGCGIAGVSPFGSTAPSRVTAKHTVGTVLVNGQAGGALKPGQPAEFRLRFADEHAGPYKEYEEEHGKYLHLIAVSQDLETFAHLHPALEAGTFRINVNQPSIDPDNQDAAGALPKPGSYILFAEVTPKGKTVQQPRMTLSLEGAEQPRPLEPDPVQADGTMRKYFTTDGQAGRPGDPYQVTLRIVRGEHHPGMPMVSLDFDLRARSGASYAPVQDLEPWLGMPGHAVLIGRDGQATDRVFRHLHAGHGGHDEATAGPEVAFAMAGQEVPASGVYKVWGQFKRRNAILTFPFVIRL